MNVVDVVVVVVALLAALQGARVGGVVQVGGIIGFFAGLFVGALLASQTVRWVQSPTATTVVALTTMLLVAFSFGLAGRILGAMMTRNLRHGPARSADAFVGVVVAVVAALATVWLLASSMVNSSSVALDNAILQSRIITALDDVMPAPPTLFTRAQGLLSKEGFPPVLAALAPASARPVPLPTDATLRAAVLAAGPSTVKVEGYGCGVLQEGSGFVVAPDLVVTNAHVVAGIAQPRVQDGSAVHGTEVVYFDPTFDLAVLRVPGLGGAVPASRPHDRPGRHPGGGARLSRGRALHGERGRGDGDVRGGGPGHLRTGPDRPQRLRDLNAAVRPGNSGGPLVLPDGEVVGVVFSRSTVDADVGYALTSPDVAARVAVAEPATAPVSHRGLRRRVTGPAVPGGTAIRRAPD